MHSLSSLHSHLLFPQPAVQTLKGTGCLVKTGKEKRGWRDERGQTQVLNPKDCDLGLYPPNNEKLFMCVKLESNKIKHFLKNHSKLDSGTAARGLPSNPDGQVMVGYGENHEDSRDI